MTDDAIPAATLVVWRDRPGAMAAGNPGRRALGQNGLCRRRNRLSRRPGRRRRPRPCQLRSGRPDDAAKITAIRETIEETGVVPAIIGRPIEPGSGRGLQAGAASTAPISPNCSASHGLALDLDALTPFARWMPAFKQARNFDTLFYLARAPRRATGRPIRRKANATPRNGPVAADTARPHRARRGQRHLSDQAQPGAAGPACQLRCRASPMPALIRSRRSFPGSRKSAASRMSAFRKVAAIRSSPSRWRPPFAPDPPLAESRQMERGPGNAGAPPHSLAAARCGERTS